MPILNGYLNIKEAAEILSIHPGTLKRLCREKKIRAEKVHNGWLIHSDVVREFAKHYSGQRGRPVKNIIGTIKLIIIPAIPINPVKICIETLSTGSFVISGNNAA